ncbi:NAD-dependent epimerase/dehydratase family protein [Rathayibacter soli]|uniref:NAD-dependent epimerase/dehydratase family protein n=1 Tax=Rathayibacter soli TaxID=3144168 RepID=UPI0027E3C04B|nr:NAD-dependent epimerase/dehydratase family protein [Glaciibacter superstes]
MAKALVIGANGFIGSHLVDELARAGHEVTAFDRFSSRTPTFQASDVRLCVGEFLSRADLDTVVQGQDLVFHFLSTTSPATAEADPTLDIRTNLAQTVELLESCANAGIAHFYFASTGGAIYGQQGRSEYAETDQTMPISPYAIGKLAIERYLRYFDATHGLASTTFRISNPYGTRQHPRKKQGLIPIALRQVLLGKPVIQYGDGSMVRDYVYVADLVRMIVATVDRETAFDVYNLGSGIGYSVSEVFESLRRVSGIDFSIEHQPTPPTFVDRVVLDTRRFRSEFGGETLTSLDDGVRLTLAEIEEELGV